MRKLSRLIHHPDNHNLMEMTITIMAISITLIARNFMRTTMNIMINITAMPARKGLFSCRVPQLMSVLLTEFTSA